MPRPSSVDDPRSPKRRRAPLACRSCRERKVRCDGNRPVCGACHRRGTVQEPCEYMVITETAKFQTERAYIQSLRDYITQLEGSAPASDIPPERLCQRDGALPASRHQEHCAHYPSPQTPPLSSSISAMGAAVTEIGETDIRDEYYGQSSLVSLVRECAHATPGRQWPRLRQADDRRTAASTNACSISCSGPGPSSLLSDDYSLPPRKTADWLLNTFFTTSHLFYPWVHKESFLASYELIWKSQSNQGEPLDDLPDVGIGGRNCPPTMFYCALNAMFAIACEFSNMPSQEKRETSRMFYERMKGLISIDIFDSGSLAHVQALLLVAMYLQCTAYPKRCWNIVGMAYRMSIGLGLHLRRNHSDMTRLEREMRWRAWCACVHMDIIVSMTMGRPAMTPVPYDVPLPSPIDDRYLAVDAEEQIEQPLGTISGNQFMYENTRLIGILGKILSTIYHIAQSGETPRRAEVDFQAVLEVDWALDEFEESLHPALQWRSPIQTQDELSSDPVCRRLSNVLHARFLHLRLLLYRPAFSEYCASTINPGAGNTKPGAQRWSMLCRANCAAGCVEAACDLIESLSRATTQDASGAWWYGIFYLVSAGIILLLANCSDGPLDGIDKARREYAWGKCIETLQQMVEAHPSARDYEIALTGLKQAQSQTVRASATENRTGQNDLNGMVWDDQSQGQPPGVDAYHSAFVNALDPLVMNWDNGIEDIMLPAQFLQEMDEGLLLPSLF